MQELWVEKSQSLILRQLQFISPMSGAQAGSPWCEGLLGSNPHLHRDLVTSIFSPSIMIELWWQGKWRLGWNKRCKVVSSFINDATNGSREGTNEEIRRLIEEWEPSQNHQTSTTDIEMEDWEAMVPDLGNTHGPAT